MPCSVTIRKKCLPSSVQFVSLLPIRVLCPRLLSYIIWHGLCYSFIPLRIVYAEQRSYLLAQTKEGPPLQCWMLSLHKFLVPFTLGRQGDDRFC